MSSEEVCTAMTDVQYHVESVGPPDPVDLDQLLSGLREFNRAKMGDLHRETIGCFAKDEVGAVVGGIHAKIGFDWLTIEFLWVHEAYRGHGLGGTLLARAEQ